MQEKVRGFVEHYIKEQSRKQKVISVLAVLSLVVAAGVFWTLRLNGIALAGEAFCGKEEHEHSEACYERVLICGLEEGHVHQHTDSCYKVQRTMECQEAEHTHSEACYKTEEILVCEKEENAEHTHTKEDGCYETREVLCCTLPEHTHSEACYKEEKVLVCKVAEQEGHIHNDKCYEEKLTCAKKEHIHTAICYSDKQADLETASVWERTLPHELSAEWPEALLKVAHSQLGYRESTRNYVLAEDEERKQGYTRYGDWYGNSYGEWCAMFVSFCLNYADIPQEAIPYEAGCQAWTVKLKDLGLYETPEEYKPESGDMIFFSYSENRRANHVGIVTELEEKENEELVVHTIEGNSAEMVRENKYNLSDSTIIGYGNLAKAKERYDRLYGQEKPAEESGTEASVLNAVIYTDETYAEKAETDETKIVVTGILPEGAEVKAYPVTVEVENRIVVAAYDISVFLADGTIYEPEEGNPVEVRFEFVDRDDTEELSVYYVPGTEEEPEKVESSVDEKAVSFVADHFSVYAVVRMPTGTAIEVRDASDFKDAFSGSNLVKLMADITIDDTNKIVMEKEQDAALDLNGHKLTVNGIETETGVKSLFEVPAGAELTIMDSQANVEPGNGTFTYTKTNSVVSNTATGATTETPQKVIVPVNGQIIAGNSPAVTVSGGTVTMESGMICNGTNRAFDMSDGTLNLDGGYVYGFKKTGAVNTGNENFGGAVKLTGGTTNISGTVLTKNEALNGGAIYVNNAVVNLSGGIISENKSTRASGWNDHSEGAPYRCGGGGIFATGSSTLTMSGGYITNNTVEDDAYFDGGGGVLISGTTAFSMSGGFITGNEAAGGGGGVRSDWAKATTFKMTGGFISGNTASSAEGGGIAITQGGSGEIRGGYITNNETKSKSHWGGGGLFCSDGAYLRVYYANITENSAGGFGGGVAGCSTGRVYVCVKDGGAIYGNAAAGTNLSGGGSQKNEDHTYAANSPVFMANGYQDYFCALNSMVEGGMLGGGTANWSGSLDGEAIKNVPKDALLEAAYVMGLTADPSDNDIAAAQGAAKLFINGNTSYTHGGGILCNGYLLIGDKNPIAVGSRFTLSGTKRLENADLKDYTFKFSVKDEAGNVVSIGTSDENGKINFDRLLSFNEELCKSKISENGGTAAFEYILTEDVQQGNLDITVDPTQYKITVTIKREDETLDFGDTEIDKAYYRITNVNVQISQDEGKTWSHTAFTWTPSNDEQHGGDLKITNGTTFTNKKVETISLTVNKQWVGTDTLPESITVDLLRDGEVVIDTVILSAENGWSYTWDKLADGYTYTVYEHPVPGYETAYITGSDEETVNGWVLADKIEAGKTYLIVSDDGFALKGNPGAGGAYDFGAGNFTPVTISDGMIATTGISEEMQWEAVALSGKAGVYLKNLPSDRKHYLSYQNTDTVKAASGDTNYASQTAIEDNKLRLYKNGSTKDIKYVTKSGNTLKATADASKAVRLYTLAGGNDDNTITITNTKVTEVYDLKLTKVSASDNSRKLEGAIFQLLWKDENEENNVSLTFRQEDANGPYIYDPDGTITDLVTDANGELYLNGLPEGVYILRETEAPDGYELAEDRTVTLGGTEGIATVNITVEDEEILYNLPETGGHGTWGYLLCGLLLMAVSLGIYEYKMRSIQERRAEK